MFCSAVNFLVIVNAQSLPSLMSTLTSVDDLRFGTAVPQTVVTEEPVSDHALLQATLAGDEAAFAELVSRYRNQITSYIYRMLNDYDGAVDMAQETFVRVYQAAERYKMPCSLRRSGALLLREPSARCPKNIERLWCCAMLKAKATTR